MHGFVPVCVARIDEPLLLRFTLYLLQFLFIRQYSVFSCFIDFDYLTVL